MSRSLDDLSSRFRPTVFEFLARAAEAGIPLLIVDTLRTPAEQEANLAKGVSWTTNSMHLPQPPDNKSLAIDVVPYSLYQLAGPDKLAWDANNPVWQKLGAIGEKLGMSWGGRWKQRDMGHFQFKAVMPPPKAEGFVA